MSACGRKVIALSSECRRPLTLALANFDAGENFLVPSRCKIRELLRGDMRFADDGAIARLVEPEPQVLFALDVLPGRVSNVATCSIRDARPGLPGEPGFRHGWGGSASPLLDVRPVRKSAYIGKTVCARTPASESPRGWESRGLGGPSAGLRAMPIGNGVDPGLRWCGALLPPGGEREPV